MLGVRADRIDHEGQFVGVIDYASSVEVHTGPDVSFDKVMAINAQRVAVPQPGHLVRRAFRQREQEWLAQPVDLTATAGLAQGLAACRNSLELSRAREQAVFDRPLTALFDHRPQDLSHTPGL
jgi:hypothetical protein